MVGFFKLIEQFTTQEEPQYCGLAALSMTLNALGVDPRRTWKGSWRWFSETMLDCCKSMEDVKRDGITLGQAACLARCNGADVSVHRYGTFDGGTFRRLLREFCSSEDRHMVVSYSRKALKQSGDGHFSPVGGYHPERDLVLILDVARFKYAPHWVAVDDLLEAMALLDPAIGRPRGFLLMSSRQPRESALFSLATNSPVPAPQPAPVTAGTIKAKPAAPPAALAPSSAATTVTACGTALPEDAAQGAGSLLAVAETGCVTAPTEGATGTAAARLCLEAEVFGGKLEGAASAACGAQADPTNVVGEASQPREREKGAAAETRTDGAAGDAPCCAASPPAMATTAKASAAAAVSAAETSTAGSCLEPEWAAAFRFVTRDAADVVRRLLEGPEEAAPEDVGGGGGGEPDDSVHEEEEEGVEVGGSNPKERGDGRLGAGADDRAGVDPGVGREGTTGAQGGAGHGGGSSGSSTGVPTLETLVAALVAAAPLESVCALLTQRQTLIAVGETRTGPCCGCAAIGAFSATAGGGGGDGCVSGPATASAAAMPPPCNISGCTRLTAAAVAAAATAAAAAAAADGNAAVQLPPPAAAAAASSSGSDAGSLDSGGGSESSFGSHGSSSGSSNCCHGEPLEHHCVPPQVQALVAGELRFTNMFKLVRYCLRRRLGCPHVRPPDLTAFMQPAGEAAAKPAANTTATLPPSTVAPTAPVRPQPTSPPATALAAAAAAAGADVATGCCNGGQRNGGNGAGNHAAGNGVGEVVVNAGDPNCDCNVDLPELAAEKLTALLLLLPVEAAGWWPAEPHAAAAAPAGAIPGPASGAHETPAVHPLPVSPQRAAAAGGSEDLSATRGAGVGGRGRGGVRLCGRPRCRTCRRRAAAAGDRLAALGLLREEWSRLLRLAPLGLYGSAPVLRDELSYLRLQLTDLERGAGVGLAAAAVA